MKPTDIVVGFSSGGDSRGRLEPETPSKTPKGAPIGNQNRLKHGVHSITRAVKKLGSNRALDMRTATGKAIARWRRELIEDLGGAETISAQQSLLIDLAATKKLIIDSIDHYIFQQPSLIDKRKRALIPVVREREQLANGLAELMNRLGLERRRKVKTLRELLGDDEPDTAKPLNGSTQPELAQ